MFIYLLSKNNKSLIFFRIVLQRQFFEALVRSASLKYANRADLPTLAEKVDALFKNKLLVHATKSKAKSVEEEVRSRSIHLCRNNTRSRRSFSKSMTSR